VTDVWLAEPTAELTIRTPQTLPDALRVPAETRQDSLTAANGQTQGDSLLPAGAPPLGQRPYGATSQDTSEYMLGDVWVTVALLESNGSIDANREDWTLAERNKVKLQVQQGLQWWEDTLAAHPGLPATPKNTLDFQLDFTYVDSPVATGVEPITRPSTDENRWIGDFLTQVGYSRASYLDGVRAWDDAQRLAHNTDWAFTVFIVDSSKDADGMFSDKMFAYTYVGGPFVVMTYTNDGWGSDRMHQVLAHEVGHVFYALDEYPGAGNYADHSGYYNTQNLNASDGNSNPGSRVPSGRAEIT
jgi:hypothetical protein